jgi:para-aminobenzoate synthetase component 1
VAHSDLTAQEYRDRVGWVREGIGRGEYYQLNLVQRFEAPLRESPAALYRRLRASNPAPFSAYLSTDTFTVLSSSPERFLEVTPGGRVRTCPIKGTRPRAADAVADAALQQELLASPKERAELLMIVDLLRNDLGRVCVPGSVQVERLNALESFATVHHLVGEVQGQLRPGLTRRELLRAVFPGGSITGAPKVSAMQAIDRLEPHRRGIGMGSIGYFSAHGRMDLAIAIRTIITHRERAYIPVGAGIVWDSDPAAEYAETLVKAQALLAALRVTPAAR